VLVVNHEVEGESCLWVTDDTLQAANIVILF